MNFHAEAEALRTSLKKFYEGAVKVGRGSELKSPAREVTYESEDANKQGFKDHLSRISKKENHII